MSSGTPVSDIVGLRCANQRLGGRFFDSAAELVAWQGAVQAQEYRPSLWGLGLRLGPNATKQSVVDELDSGAIVRTWLMRGTIHYAPTKDVRWMVQLLGSRINEKYVRYYEKVDLTPKVFTVGKHVLTATLSGGAQATRKELYAAFEQAGIAEPSKRGRGSFILQYWAQEGLICFGPYRGKQQTFVLLDEWVPESIILTRDKALATITKRYFTSHGPATVQDFVYWSGLNMSEAKHGISLNKDELTATVIGTTTYWLGTDVVAGHVPAVCLLPCFDEYAVGYKDRGTVLDADFREQLGYGINYNIILQRGHIVGTWQMPSTPDDQPSTQFIQKPSTADRRLIQLAIDRYKHFAFN